MKIYPWKLRHEVLIDDNFSCCGAYRIEAIAGLQKTSNLIVVSKYGHLCGSVNEKNLILVFTDKDIYNRTDSISVYGCLANVAYTKGINIAVLDENENVVAHKTIVPNFDRTFSVDFKIDDKFLVSWDHLF